MANQVGLFFKELSSNEYVKSVVNLDDDTEEENLEVKTNKFISKLLESEELMVKLKTFVDDDKFIKDKIETFVKQALKKKQKPIEKVKEIIKTDTCKCDPCKCDPCKCDPCKCDPCKCDPCKCDPCKCDPCKCDPCKCDPCKCDPHKLVKYNETNYYSDNIYLGKYNKEEDTKNDKVKWIVEDIRLEHIDHLIKMTTCNFEVFY